MTRCTYERLYFNRYPKPKKCNQSCDDWLYCQFGKRGLELFDIMCEEFKKVDGKT